MRSSVVALLCLVCVSLAACDTRIVDERSPAAPTPIVVTPTPTPSSPVPAPTVALFIAEPTRVFLGSTVVLRWDVTLPPGTAVSTPVSVRVDPAPGTVPVTGVAVVQPFARGLYTAVLTAETTGGRASRVVQVQVD